MTYQQNPGKEPTLEYRYYISSAALSAHQFAEAVRGHWNIESQLHWVLDATMREDACQIFRDHGAQNMTILRQLSLNMLRAEDTQISMRRKRKRAMMQIAFLEEILKAAMSKNVK